MSTNMGFYAIRLSQERAAKGDLWTAEHPHLLGCHVVRPTAQQAIDDLADARREWEQRAREAGRQIPDPQPDLKYELVMAPDHTADEADGARTAVLSAHEAQEVRVATAWSS